MSIVAQEAFRPMTGIRSLLINLSIALLLGLCAASSAHAVASTNSATALEPAISPRDEPSDPAPAGSPPLRRAEDGVTAVAGRVLQTDGAPLQGVVLKIGTVRAETDADGLFLLAGVSPGAPVMLIDGRHALARGAAEPADHGTYEARIEIEAGRTTALPWVSWLPLIDHAHDVTLSIPATEDVVVRTPAIPGLELRIPKGAVLTGLDGKLVTHVGLTPIPVARPPFPLPRNVAVPVYFTAQPGGTVISGADGQWLGAQVVYPNYGRALPKARGVFWRYDPDGIGWSPYGMGTVQADGRQVVPDRDTRIYALSGAMFNGGGGVPAPKGPPPAPNVRPDGDPVDLASGFYVDRRTDLALGGVLPIAVTRTYRPGDYNSRAFGVGMSLSYSSTLHSTNQYQVVDLIQPDGGLVHYTRIVDPNNPTDNNWATAHFTTNAPGPFYHSHIDWNGNGWTLVRKDGTVYTFGENAPLQSIQDRFGNKITLTRSSGTSGNIIQVSGPSGRFIRFSYDGSRIVQAIDNIGRTVSYAYDGSGQLSTVTNANGGVTTYAWDSSHRVRSITDARNVAYITNTYDANDRLTNQVLADGTSYQFAYTLDGNGNVTETDVTDPRGFVRKVTFNAAGYALTQRYAAGTPQESAWSYTLDPTSNLPLSSTDPLGRRTDRTYDVTGNVLTITRLAGTSNAVTTSYTYTPVFNQLASTTDPLGHVSQLQRDSLDRLTAVVDPLNNTTLFSYTTQGTLLTATDPLSNLAQLGYGPDGDLTSLTDPLGRVTALFTDPIGRYLTAADPLGNRMQWVHDPINGLRQIADPNGATVTTNYTSVGDVASVVDARGGQVAFTFDARGLPATRTDPVNAVAHVTQRDSMGNVLASSDRKGQAASFTYDPLNRPLTASYADGSTLAWTWDLGGRLTQLQDSIGGTTTRAYDGLDRLTSETTPQGTVSYTYDTAGRRLTMQAASQAQVSYTYDNANRLTGISQGSTSLSFGYDAAGRRTSATLPGGITATYTWDAASQLTGITYASGSTTLGTLTYGYDLAGRVVARGGTLFQSVLPAAVTSASYDLANRLTSRTAAGITATPAWDANGNLTNDGVRSYTWDARDRLTAIPGVASFVYDGFRRRQTATRGGTATSFLYDGWDVAQEQQGGTPSADLLIGLGVDERFARGGATFLTDGLGSTLALASAGSVATSYGYDPYGVAQVTGTASDNPFQYTGRENDGTGLLHYRNRYYSPTWARFVSEDPIGLGGGDVNLYRYVANNPVQGRDPSGNFFFIPVIIGAIGAIGAEAVEAGIIVGGSYIACRAMGGCQVPSPPPYTPSSAYPPAPTVPASDPANPCSLGNVSCATPPDNAYDPNGPKAPGKPGPDEGFKDPKGGDNWVRNPNGRGYGWEDASGDVWVPTGQGGGAHGGPHWDVQTPGGGYRVVRPIL
jgi:RHS repeat-associated protein